MKFIKIPELLFDLDLSPSAIMVYSSILSLQCASNTTTASASTIGKRCGLHRNTVLSAVKQLVDAGTIKKLTNRENNYKKANTYIIRPLYGFFASVDTSIFRHNLLPTQFVAYVALCRYRNKTGMAFPSLHQLAERCHLCVDTIVNNVRKLCHLGLIKIRRFIRKCGCFGHNNYVVYNADEVNTSPVEMEETRTETKSTAYSLTDSNEPLPIWKRFFLFLNRRYSKNCATILEPLKYFVRKRKKAFYI